MISLKSKREIGLIRDASKIVREVLEDLGRIIKPGVTTRELDERAEKMIRNAQAVPAFKNYHGFPASICASINDEVVHGIPSDRALTAGDIIGIDVGVKYEGYHSDAARTFPVSSISKAAQELILVTEQSFFKGIENIKGGSRLGDISHAIQSYVEAQGYSVVRDFVGHGIGREMHEEPQIPNFGHGGTGPVLEAGMTLAIEPMVNQGTWRVYILDNKWTVVTKDGLLSAHYENTVVITKDAVEVLT